MALSGLKETTGCMGYAQHTSTGSAFGLATTPATGVTLATAAQHGTKPTAALLQAEAQNLRWRDDGTDPTSSVGMILAAGTSYLYDGDLNRIKFIAASGGAILNVAFYC